MEPFLESGLTFSILQLLRIELILVERLQSWKIDLAKISAPSFIKITGKLSMPATLDEFKSFQVFIIFSGEVSENSKFKSLDLILS